MSADLLAAFGDPSPSQTNQASKPTAAGIQQPNQGGSSTQGGLLDFQFQSPNPAPPSQPRDKSLFQPDPSSGNDVLFDAANPGDDSEEEDDDVNDQDVFDDDFGDFEDASAPVSHSLEKDPNHGTMTSLQDFRESSHGQAPTRGFTPISQPVQKPMKPAAPIAQTQQSFDLLSLDDEPAPPLAQTGPSNDSFSTPAIQPQPQGQGWGLGEHTQSNPPGILLAWAQQQQKPSITAPKEEVKDDDTFSDDWGDFMSGTASSPKVTTKSPPLSPSRPIPSSSTSTSISTRLDQKATVTSNPTVKTAAQPLSKPPTTIKKTATKPAKPTPAPKQEEFDEWQDFIDGPTPSTVTVSSSKSPSISSPSKSPPISIPPLPTPTSSPDRPTNVPPPSILIQLFPQIIDQLEKDISSSLATTTMTPLQTQTISSLCQNLLLHHNTLIHIISGRTLRWKRDTLLSQSMRISAVGGSTSGRGMKLASVDKMEGVKEEGVVTEVISIWNSHTRLFNSILSRTHSSSSTSPSSAKKPIGIKPMSMLRVTTSNQANRLKSKESCVVCGMKRDERVQGVDTEDVVEDSFGEWWVETWGHRGCWVWWDRCRGLLSGRG